MRRYRFLWLFLLAALAVTACVYDFHPQIDGEGGYLIVEGNIVVGDRFDILTNWSWSLVDTTQSDEQRRILYTNKMHVEASDGTRYENQFNTWGSWWGTNGSPRGSFDLRDADPSLQYRLVIENDKGTYVSSWEKPLAPGQIDSLSYRISGDKTTMSILVAAHSSDAAESYYRWSVDETWEYHADVQAFYKYVEEDGQGRIDLLEKGESLYYCWVTNRRPEIMIGTTQGLKEDRLADHQLYTISHSDNRVSILYRADVRQMRIPEEAYRYWQAMERNSHDVGGLFSPEPSELRGNVTCVERPDEMVLGYVGVMSVATRRLEIDNYEVRFYHQPYVSLPVPDTLGTAAEWAQAYRTGMSPAAEIWSEFNERLIGYEWWPVRCLDCRFKGGSKNRPADWPNNHY